MTSILVHSPNWLGDVVMVLPALQAFHAEHPEVRIGVVCKKSVSAIWKYCSVPIDLHVYGDGLREMVRIGFELQGRRYERAILAAHTPRAALVMRLGKVQRQRCFVRGFNRFLVSDPVIRPLELHDAHQSVEYGYLFELPQNYQLPPPKLTAPNVALDPQIEEFIQHGVVALLPGAKRGPSKQWPAERYSEIGKMLISQASKKIFVLGDPNEKDLCESIAQQIDSPEVLSLAGRTNFAQWLQILSLSNCVICNDSGGMHVAAALGTPVVAIFGITDPVKTGPLGKDSVVLQKSTLRSRAVPRVSEQAAKALNSIEPQEVLERVTSLMEHSHKGRK
jgi:heptosyltransferase II